MSPTRDKTDDLPIFRPRFGRRQAGGARAEDTTFRNALLRSLRRAFPSSPGSGAAGTAAVGSTTRRVVVKAHVARMTAGGAIAAARHVRYIERDGVEKDGSKGVLYTAEVPARTEVFEQPRPGEAHQFRLIVSPEDAAELDLTVFVRRLMARVERDLAQRLEWAAVNHYDTDHPHAHIIVRGVDPDGREVRLPREYISRGLRWRAQEIATEELGPRRELDVRRMYEKEVTQERFTSLDREIERRLRGSRVHVRSPAHPGLVDESTLVARLDHLEQLRLAERVSPKGWILADGWQGTLRALGSRGDILKRMHAALSGDPARYHVVRPGRPLAAPREGEDAAVVGRVAEKGLGDELRGSFYAIIETPSGHAYHVPLDARGAETSRAGDLVSLTSRSDPPVRPIDRHLAEVAASHGGLYTIDAASGEPRAVAARRRLNDLAALHLATPEAPNQWRVSPALHQELERRQHDVPLPHRIVVAKHPLRVDEQVRYHGPVWLDRLDAGSLAAYGFGAEVRRALQDRRDALRQLGIDAADPNLLARLRELERTTVGAELAARSGQAFVRGVPDGFRGRHHTHTASGGTAYSVVSDGFRFVLLPAPAAARAGDLQDKFVRLARDADGGHVVRIDTNRDRER